MGWWLWRFFDGTLHNFPVELIFLAAGLGVSLVWFRRQGAKEEDPLPKGLKPLLVLQLAGITAAWFVLWVVIARPQGPTAFFQEHAALARHVADILLWMGFLLSLTGVWALVQARLTDRRWRAGYALSLTTTVLVMAALSLLWDMSLGQTSSLSYYILLTVLGLAGTGASLC